MAIILAAQGWPMNGIYRVIYNTSFTRFNSVPLSKKADCL